jgi:FkbM family methyltransferase
MKYDISRLDILKKLFKRETEYNSKMIAQIESRKVAVFTAGPTATGFVLSLKDKFGIKADIFIDNDRVKCGAEMNAMPVLYKPWLTHNGFSEEYAIIVATSRANYSEIARQLEEAGITLYMHYSAYLVSKLSADFLTVCTMLEDVDSKCAFLSSAYAMLTGDNSLMHFSGQPYFSHIKFCCPAYEIVVDAGAYVGDSLEQYIINSHGVVKRIYAFEAYDRAFKALETRARRLRTEWCLEDAVIITENCALSDTDEDLRFSGHSGDNGMYMKNEFGEILVRARTLDDYFERKEKPSLIKSDIEGMEQKLLLGARKIIENSRPKLAISIYHSAFDMVEIPLLVAGFSPLYKFAVGTHTGSFEDTILYCWSDKI